MNNVQLIFSPTGGTRKVADAITSAWGEQVQTVDLTDAQMEFSDISFEKNDLVLIAVPSYGGRVPALALDRIRKLKGCSAYCAIVCVYGNRAYEDTLVELQDTVQEAGFRVIAAVAAIAEHSIMHQYAAGRPDKNDVDVLKGYGKAILEKANQGNCREVGQLPGNRPYKKAGGAGLVPKAGKGCVGCGLCAEHCPAQAISKTSIKTADAKKCISCMRCVVECPHSAREVNALLVSAAAAAIKKACSVKKENELFIE